MNTVGIILRMLAMLWLEHKHPSTVRKYRRVKTAYHALNR